jgi:RimJ/RimL family protein N-acetyltransferase
VIGPLIRPGDTLAPPLATILETERLRLRQFTPHDLDEQAAMVADPEQMTFHPRPKTREEAAAWIERNLALYRERGYGVWAMELIDGGPALAGYCGIRPLELDDGTREIEVGWHVHKRLWGEGIATEVAAAVRDHAFERLGLRRLVAIIPPEHIASRRVAEKIGMRGERTSTFEGEPVIVYATEHP